MSITRWRPNTLSCMESLGQVETCDVEVEDRYGDQSYAVHGALQIDSGAATVFQGSIDETELFSLESPYKYNASHVAQPNPVGARVWKLKGQGLSGLARRQVTGAFSAQARIGIATVVSALVAPLGLATSIATNPSSLPLTDSFLSEQETIADVLTRLADLATAISGVQHVWRIGWPGTSFSTVTLYFQPVTNLGSSASIGPVAGATTYKPRSGSIHYRVTREQFANSVILKLDRYLKDGGDAQVDNKHGSDIFLGTLTVSSPMASQPTIKVNDVEETVGIKDSDTGKQWYWSLGSTVLKVGSSSASGSDTIEVTYAAHDIRAVTATNSGSVGAVGLFQVPINSVDTGNMASPASQAAAELSRRDSLIEHVTCQIQCPARTFNPGDVIGCTFTGFGTTGTSSLTGNFVLQSIRTFDESFNLWYELDLMRGPLLYRASSFVRRIGSLG